MSSSPSTHARKLVFLTKESPFPPAGGAHIRDAHLINIFRETMEVEVLCFSAETDDGFPAEPSMKAGDLSLPTGVHVTRITRKRGPIWKRALSTFKPEVQGGYCEAMAQAIRARAEPGKLLWVSRLGMGQYLELAKKLGYRTVLDQHQVETQVLWNNAYASASQFSTAVKGVTNLALAAQCGYYEGRICRQSDAVVATSDLDASRLLKLAPGAPVHVIPHAIDCSKYAAIRTHQGKTILFSGTLNYPPNIEAIEWYIDEILPRLKASMGSACPRLIVAGTNPSSDLYRRLDQAGAELHADPPSLLPFLSNAALVIMPLRSGRSMRFKILEAMASGRAVLSTPRGSEGLVLAPGYDIWIAESTDKFASAVSRLIENTELRLQLGINAAKTADARYDWQCARVLLETLLQRLSHPIIVTE
jgi:glycosyltransferase involved in cell wall biosynthesis